MKITKRGFIIPLFAIMIGILVIGGVYLYSKQEVSINVADNAGIPTASNATSSATTSSDNNLYAQGTSTINWKTYDSGRGFYLQYPEGSVFDTHKVDGGTEVTFAPIGSKGRLDIVITPSEGANVDVCHIQNDKGYTSVVINNSLFAKSDISNHYVAMNSVGSVTRYCIIKNNTAYYLTASIQMFKDNGVTSNSAVDSDPVLNQMIASFHIN